MTRRKLDSVAVMQAATVLVPVGGDILELAIRADQYEVCAASLRKIGATFTKYAEAALLCARARGDNHDDVPGTFDNALAAAQILLSFANGIQGVAASIETLV